MAKLSTSALGIMILTVIGYGIGFLVQVVIAHTLGVGAALDAFVVASIIPEFIFGITNAIFLTAFVVIFPEYLKQQKEVKPFISTLFTLLTLFLGVCILIIVFFAGFLAKKIAPGFTESQFALTVLLIRLLSFSIFFFGLSSFMTGILNHEHHFLVPKATRSIIGIGILIAVFIVMDVTVFTLVFGTIVGIAIVVAIEYVMLKKKGYSFSFSLDNQTYDSIKSMLSISSPLLCSSVLYYGTKIAMNMFATTMGEGSVSILNYAFLVSTLPVIFFSGSISSTIFPYITKKYVYEKNEEANFIFVKSLSVLLIVLIPFTILFIMMPTQIIRFLFERGEFTSASTEAVGKALFYYSLGILPSGLWASILSIYYAKKKMWKQLILYVLFFLLSVAFTALFINTLSYNAIPLAWSISYWLVVISGGVYVLKKVGIDIIKLKKTVFTGIIAASGMALFIFTYLLCATKIPSLQKDVVMVGCIFLSLGIYVGILRLINAEELDFILNVLRMS